MTTVARKTPLVRDKVLVRNDGNHDRSIVVGTPEWLAWLGQTSTFAYLSSSGRFTARKERFQRGGWYWRAYRTCQGRVHRAYLGKGEALTAERLQSVATELAKRSGIDATAPACPSAADEQVIPSSKRSSGGKPVDSRQRSRRAGVVSSRVIPRTKVLVPPPGSHLIERPRLIQKIGEVLQRKLTLISAPAGSGKTTLLSQWNQTGKCPVAWVALDPTDNDLVRFWSCVAAAIQVLHDGLASEALALLHSSALPPVESFLTKLIDAIALVRDDFVLVLDDYHVVKEASIHSAMSFLVEHLPPQMHIMIATRSDPPLPLARLRAMNQLAELRVADLSFNSEETLAFLNGIMQLALPTEQVEALAKRTEGWIAGLQLAALSLQGSNNSSGLVKALAGDQRHVFDYLVEEVLRLQSEDVQTFLLQTAILDRLSGPLCNAVTGQENGQLMLETLERANLFTVPLDNDRHWYRYHHLFVDFLRACLHRARLRDIPELHRRASAWYLANGLMGEAVNHALAAGEFDLAARVIEESAMPILRRSEVRETLQWLKALPEDLVRSRPRLCIVHAWALITVHQVEAAEARLRDAERLLSGGDPALVAVQAKNSFADVEPLLGELDAVRAAIAVFRGEAPLAITLSHRALASSVGNDPGLRSIIVRNLAIAHWRNGDVEAANRALAEVSVTSQVIGYAVNAIAALGQLADIQVVQGRLREAARTYRRALQLLARQDTQTSSAAGRPYIGMGRLLYEWNDLNGARNYIAKAIDLAEETGMPDIMLAGLGTMARVKQAEGNVSGALDIVEHAEQLAIEHGLPGEVERLAAYRARLWLLQGNIEAAVHWADTSGLRSADEPSHQKEAGYMMLARVMTAQGKAGEALALLERLLHAAETAGRGRSMIKIQVGRALAFHAQGRGNEALECLERALSMAEPEQYVRAFVDAGPPMATLLSRLPEAGRRARLRAQHSIPLASPAYVRSLLAAFETGAAPAQGREGPAREQQSVDWLSQRELEVLRLVAAGKSSAEIARELVVSPNTIKTHLKNIYSKLGVHGAGEAIARARDLLIL